MLPKTAICRRRCVPNSFEALAKSNENLPSPANRQHRFAWSSESGSRFIKLKTKFRCRSEQVPGRVANGARLSCGNGVSPLSDQAPSRRTHFRSSWERKMRPAVSFQKGCVSFFRVGAAPRAVIGSIQRNSPLTYLSPPLTPPDQPVKLVSSAKGGRVPARASVAVSVRRPAFVVLRRSVEVAAFSVDRARFRPRRSGMVSGVSFANINLRMP